jgi:hypothetical protein
VLRVSPQKASAIMFGVHIFVKKRKRFSTEYKLVYFGFDAKEPVHGDA